MSSSKSRSTTKNGSTYDLTVNKIDYFHVHHRESNAKNGGQIIDRRTEVPQQSEPAEEEPAEGPEKEPKSGDLNDILDFIRENYNDRAELRALKIALIDAMEDLED